MDVLTNILANSCIKKLKKVVSIWAAIAIKVILMLDYLQKSSIINNHISLYFLIPWSYCRPGFFI